LARRLKETINDFDVVHLHSVFLWPTWAAARAAYAARIPYVVSPRGQLVRELIHRKSRWVKSAWIALIERRTLARAAALHVTADLEAQDIAALNLNLAKVVCIANGVSWPAQHQNFESEKYPQITGPYALYLGRINWKKGLDRLIRAWRQVPDLTLIIAGNDDEGYQKDLEALVHDIDIANRVHFIGPVSDVDKWAVYERAEMFVLSSYSENFGNVVAEAMAMGCPVVVTPEVGLARFVAEARAGIITDGDPMPLSAAVRKLHGDALLRKSMGIAGRLAVEKSLSWGGIALQLEAAYNDIIASSGTDVEARLHLATRR